MEACTMMNPHPPSKVGSRSVDPRVEREKHMD
jgi:hypothetical protein